MTIIKRTFYLLLGLLALCLLPIVARAQSGATTYIHGQGLPPLVTLDGQGTPTLYIPGPNGQPIAQVVVNANGQVSQTTWLLPDHLGSTRLALTDSNQVQARFDYTPFGETTAVNGVGAGVQPILFRYTGQEVNGELGTYHYHARQYDPLTGRFLSVDPARYNASPYVYVNNDPINFVDPDGQTPTEADEMIAKDKYIVDKALNEFYQYSFFNVANKADVEAEAPSVFEMLKRTAGEINTPAIKTAYLETVNALETTIREVLTLPVEEMSPELARVTQKLATKRTNVTEISRKLFSDEGLDKLFKRYYRSRYQKLYTRVTYYNSEQRRLLAEQTQRIRSQFEELPSYQAFKTQASALQEQIKFNLIDREILHAPRGNQEYSVQSKVDIVLKAILRPTPK